MAAAVAAAIETADGRVPDWDVRIDDRRIYLTLDADEGTLDEYERRWLLG